MTNPKIAVDIWSDVMCPWCAVGYTQFAKAIEGLKGELDVEVRWMPFELNPDLPAEGKEQAAHLGEVYGRTPDEVAEMRAQMQASAARAGYSMEYSGEGEEPPAMMWNTFAAHRLLRWALTQAGPEGQTRLKEALFAAHFQKRRNIADREVLLDIVESLGFDRSEASEALDDEALSAATRIEEERGRRAGINSVPSFVINGNYLIQGARDAGDYAGLLRQVAGMTANA